MKSAPECSESDRNSRNTCTNSPNAIVLNLDTSVDYISQESRARAILNESNVSGTAVRSRSGRGSAGPRRSWGGPKPGPKPKREGASAAEVPRFNRWRALCTRAFRDVSIGNGQFCVDHVRMIATTDATVFLLGGRRLGPAHQEAKPHHQGLSRFCVLCEPPQVGGKWFPRFLRAPRRVPSSVKIGGSLLWQALKDSIPTPNHQKLLSPRRLFKFKTVLARLTSLNPSESYVATIRQSPEHSRAHNELRRHWTKRTTSIYSY